MEYPVAIRSADVSDLDAIFVVFHEVAYRIPTKLGTVAHVTAMRQQMRDCYFDGNSLVATDRVGKIVAFQLAQERQWCGEQQINLAYVGVTPTFEGRGVLRQLIEAMKRQQLPLVAEVKSGNKSDMGARLRRMGFQLSGPCLDGEEYRWEP
jgi:ribosomal protein S18 acetylase RimI-like enzyme